MSKELFTGLTPGKLMGLRQITDEKGRFKVLAMDQSNSFKKALRAMHEKAGAPAEPDYAEVRDCKIEMSSALAHNASALLLDVNFGLRQALNSMAFPKNVGLIARVEASKNAGSPGGYEPGWGVEKIKQMGASAVKLLVFLDTEDKESTKSQIEFVKKVSKACKEQDILLMTEELSYPREGETKKSETYTKRLFNNILEATKLIGPHTDILKLEFPGTVGVDSDEVIAENLKKLDAAAIRPWVILSAGVDFDVFEGQVEKALQAGCNGYMAGRAIFKEYFEGTDEKAHQEFLKTKATDRMKTLNAMVDKYAKSWMERYGITPADMAAAVSETWYLDKGAAPTRQAETTGAY
jgi:tagatose 1,6-diphosphate aldolase